MKRIIILILTLAFSVITANAFTLKPYIKGKAASTPKIETKGEMQNFYRTQVDHYTPIENHTGLYIDDTASS